MHLQARHLGRSPASRCQGQRRLWSTTQPRPLHLLQSHIACWQQRNQLRCKAQTTDESEVNVEDKKIKSTLADLDAILGIQEEEPPAAASANSPEVKDDSKADTFNSAVQLEVQKMAPNDPSKANDLKPAVSDAMMKIVDRAKSMAEKQTQSAAETEASKQVLKQEFQQLLNVMFIPSLVDKDDIKKLKDAGVFGPQTFWVTEMRLVEEKDKMGILVRGNLRDDRDKLFKHVCERVAELFQGKYVVLLIDDPELSEEDMVSETPKQRVAFQLTPAVMMEPPQTAVWQYGVALLLAGLLVGSCGQLSLVANISKLPKETLEWFANPDNLNSNMLPPGLDTWDPQPYIMSAVPIAASNVAINFSHELGHRLAAAVRNVKLGPTYFIPNLQLGSFGAITPITSLLKNRRDLWDVAFSGPLVGGLASLALLLAGYYASSPEITARELLVAVPKPLFQGSLLLGTMTKLVLPSDLLNGQEVLIHPLSIAGWCGMITTALNLLPVGCLDGGRMVQAAYGKNALALTSFFTYVGLGLGLLGSSLALPFGLYVLICQRASEKYIQDQISPAGDYREAATAVAILLAILTLVPMAPELADSVGMGVNDAMFY